MKKTSVIPILTGLFLFCFSCADQKTTISLPRSTPEAEGVSSRAILTFLDSAKAGRHEFHSFMFLRHGKVIAEGWWNPYAPELKHTLYSTSKSFTSTAIGLAVKEKLLSLEDNVISFFPEYLPDSVSNYLASLKIKHLLTMSAGQMKEPPMDSDEWIRAFLETPVVREPGTIYRYSSMASFILSAIIQKVTGQRVIDYLSPRLFVPLGIEDADWETNPEGINTGGWGLRLKTEDLAKLGQLYLQKGIWNGKQILSSEWVEEATSLKIHQNPELTDEQRASLNDAVQGYCYQFWRAKNNSYMANGAFGQFILVIPDKDAVIVFTAESPDMWGELDMVWKYLYPGITHNALPPDKRSEEELKQRLASLSLPLPDKTANEALSSKLSGRLIIFPENQKKIESMSLGFSNDICHLKINTDTAAYEIDFAAGKWLYGETLRHGPSIFEHAKGSLQGLPPFKIAGTFSWPDENTLELTLRYIENCHSEKLIFHFEEMDKNIIRTDLKSSIPPGNRIVKLEGSVK